MNDRYLYRAKRKKDVEWVEGAYYIEPYTDKCFIIQWNSTGLGFNEFIEVDGESVCQCTGIKDKNGKLIWDNDILMCHGNKKDLCKVCFGEFKVIDIEDMVAVDIVQGWYYKPLETDGLSKCEPFCYEMPLTNYYLERMDAEVIGNIFDNPELFALWTGCRN